MSLASCIDDASTNTNNTTMTDITIDVSNATIDSNAMTDASTNTNNTTMTDASINVSNVSMNASANTAMTDTAPAIKTRESSAVRIVSRSTYLSYHYHQRNGITGKYLLAKQQILSKPPGLGQSYHLTTAYKEQPIDDDSPIIGILSNGSMVATLSARQMFLYNAGSFGHFLDVVAYFYMPSLHVHTPDSSNNSTNDDKSMEEEKEKNRRYQIAMDLTGDLSLEFTVFNWFDGITIAAGADDTSTDARDATDTLSATTDTLDRIIVIGDNSGCIWLISQCFNAVIAVHSLLGDSIAANDYSVNPNHAVKSIKANSSIEANDDEDAMDKTEAVDHSHSNGNNHLIIVELADGRSFSMDLSKPNQKPIAINSIQAQNTINTSSSLAKQAFLQLLKNNPEIQKKFIGLNFFAQWTEQNIESMVHCWDDSHSGEHIYAVCIMSKQVILFSWNPNEGAATDEAWERVNTIADNDDAMDTCTPVSNNGIIANIPLPFANRFNSISSICFSPSLNQLFLGTSDNHFLRLVLNKNHLNNDNSNH